MWKITQSLGLQSVYKNKKLNINGTLCRVRAMYDKNGKEISSGLINLKTCKFSFYSRSPQTHLLIEVSSDLYKFDHNGQLQTEKAVSFVRSYFEHSIKDFSCHNEVTIVLYSRLFYPNIKSEQQLKAKMQEHIDTSQSLHSWHLNDMCAF